MLAPPSPTTWHGRTLSWGQRTHVMGILNITPDSFSRDGLLLDDMRPGEVVRMAVAHAKRMVDEGATLIDVGGESTRPSTVDAAPLPVGVELKRVVPVVQALATELPSEVIISVDTSKAEVARAALDAGASLVNDVRGGQGDPDMLPLVADRGIPIVLMSNLRGRSRHGPLADVTRQLALVLDAALGAGVAWDLVILDPGFGFGLTAGENLDVLRELATLKALGRPLLVGTSRKSHIGLVLGTPVEDRIEGTAATVALAIAQGVDIVRVHDVHQMARVARMADAVVRGWPGADA